MADQELVVKFKGDLSDLERSFARAEQLADKYSGSTGRATSATQKFDRAGSDLNNTFGNMVKGYLGLSAAMEAGKLFLDATSKVQKFENQLKVASGTQEDYAKNTAFLEGLADKYNKNVLELGKSYAQLTIATRGTNLEGEKADRLFAAVTATSSALQMSVDETNGTFQAFIQMVSKGNVQAEELRGQLGERLYGAFNLAAQAMGKSTSELNEMLENGEVLAEDLLPKLTVELEKTFGAQAQANANNLGSNIDYAKGQAMLFLGEFGKTSGITDDLNDMASAMGSLFNWLRKLNEESSISEGFFDRMFTLPGNSITKNASSRGFESIQEFTERIQKEMAAVGAAPFSDALSTTDSNAYGAQYGIRDVNAGAEEKIRRANEAAANKAQAAINRQVSQWIQESKDRIAEGILNAEIENSIKFGRRNSPISTPSALSSIGVQNTLPITNGEAGKPQASFVKQVGNAAQNYKNLTQSLGEMTRAYLEVEAAQRKAAVAARESNAANAEMSLSIEGITSEIEGMLTMRFGSMAAAAENGWAELIKKMKSGTMSYKEAQQELLKVVADERLGESIKSSLANAISSTANGVGGLVAGIANGTSDLADVGNTFLSIIATLFKQIGDALSTWAATMLVAKVAFSTNNIAGALIGAALAYGASAVAESQIQSSNSQALWTGGFVKGKGGVDQVQTSLTAGELVLNGNQQNRLWGIISGAYSHQDLPGMSGGNAMGGEITVVVKGGIKRGDIDFAGKQGAKDNNYFRVKRG